MVGSAEYGNKGEGESEVRLFFALEGIVALLAGADLYYIFHLSLIHI